LLMNEQALLMNEQALLMNNFKEFKIAILSLLVIFLCVIITISQKHTVDVGIYLEGDKANIVKVVDLSLNYNDNLNLVSYSRDGLLKVWDGKRFLLMPNPDSSEKQLIRLRFAAGKPVVPGDIKIMPESQVYLSNIGSVSLPNHGISFKLNYE